MTAKASGIYTKLAAKHVFRASHIPQTESSRFHSPHLVGVVGEKDPFQKLGVYSAKVTNCRFSHSMWATLIMERDARSCVER